MSKEAKKEGTERALKEGRKRANQKRVFKEGTKRAKKRAQGEH